MYKEFLQPTKESRELNEKYPFTPLNIACGDMADEWKCTRDKGHDGDHIAHCGFAGDYRVVATWNHVKNSN
jgi:hypothetical protein